MCQNNCCVGFWATFVACVLLGSISAPWYTTVSSQVVKATSTSSEQACARIVDIAWKKQYCRTTGDCCTGSSPCITCNGFEGDWQDNCSNCDEKKALYNGVLSVHILALLAFAPAVLYGWGRCCCSFRKRKLFMVFPVAAAVLMAIAIITFPARLPKAYTEDQNGSCAFGPCDKFIGGQTIDGTLTKQVYIWFGSGYFGGVMAFLILLCFIPCINLGTDPLGASGAAAGGAVYVGGAGAGMQVQAPVYAQPVTYSQPVQY